MLKRKYYKVDYNDSVNVVKLVMKLIYVYLDYSSNRFLIDQISKEFYI